MPGDVALGTVVRDLRRARKLTLAAVARRAGCAESQLSYVESGRRQLHRWLAEKLDAIYDTGGIITRWLAGKTGRVARLHCGYPMTLCYMSSCPEEVVRCPFHAVSCWPASASGSWP